jgi:YVTN family beta-propeller protein
MKSTAAIALRVGSKPTARRRLLTTTPIALAALVAVMWPLRTVGSPFAYITNSDDGTVSVIDTTTNAVTATIPVGAHPGGVAVHPTGTRVYVTDDEGLSVIDTATNTLTTSVPVGAEPNAVAVNRAGTLVYVVNYYGAAFGSLPGSVSVIDAVTDTVISTVSVGDLPRAVTVSPDGARVYVTNTLTTVEHRPCSLNPPADCIVPLSIIDATTNHELLQWPVGDALAGVAVNPAGTRVYVANQAPWNGMLIGVISVIDTAIIGVVDKVTVGRAPAGVAVDASGGRLYVANNLDNTVSVVDTATNNVVATVPVQDGPAGVALTPDGARVYVANGRADTVSVIDASSDTVVATIPVGHGPIAFGQFIGPAVIGTSPTPTTSPTVTPTPRDASTVPRASSGGGGCVIAPHTGGPLFPLVLCAALVFWRHRLSNL